jgi:hypothetical protein
MDNGKVIQIGNLYPDTPKFRNRTSGRVYDIEGIAPTINTCGGGHREPKIVVYEGDIRPIEEQRQERQSGKAKP